jgi:hypothetical protein
MYDAAVLQQQSYLSHHSAAKRFLSQQVDALAFGLCSDGKLFVQLRRNAQVELA